MVRPTAHRLRALGAAVLLPIGVTVLVTNVDLGPFGPPALYLLAVVVAAAVGGLWSGLGAAAFSFLGLNFYFTDPVHTLRVNKSADLVALLVFLGVAAIVGALFARVVGERERVARREEELRLVNRFATRLMSTELDHGVVLEVATTLLPLLDLSACVIDVEGDATLSASAKAPGGAPDSFGLDVPIAAAGADLGTLRVARSAGSTGFGQGDERLLQALAGQLGLAIERRRSEAAARVARTGAEVSEIRAALFSSVTHDLRTPLASIKAGITGLMDDQATYSPDERSELLSTVLEETDRLNRLVDNLLNLARARAGDIAIDKELTPIEDVVETVLARLKNTLAPFTVRTMIREGLPGVWMDPVKMDQALTNIIENAARHAPAGTDIQVAVTLWREGIHIRVADHGPGVPPEEREQVFEPFYRGRGKTGSGSGLGLAIARAVVQAHDGRIWMEGAPGGGTAVVIELPVAAQSEKSTP